MPEPLVSDSTPLIALARIDRLDLLELLFGAVFIPPEVSKEILSKGRSKRGRQALQAASWMTTHELSHPKSLELVSAALNQGEREAIALARNLGRDLLIDDLAGRHEAERLNVSIVGSAGVLLQAKSEGLIPDVAPILESLLGEGFYLSDELHQTILRHAGEWEEDNTESD